MEGRPIETSSFKRVKKKAENDCFHNNLLHIDGVFVHERESYRSYDFLSGMATIYPVMPPVSSGDFTREKEDVTHIGVFTQKRKKACFLLVKGIVLKKVKRYKGGCS
jgi:hypothetical protein